MMNRSTTQQGLRVHPFDPLCAPGARLERIRKILCFPCNLIAAELHDAHGVGRLTIICQDVFGDPKITAANDSPHSETLFTRLLSACDLYVASTRIRSPDCGYSSTASSR